MHAYWIYDMPMDSFIFFMDFSLVCVGKEDSMPRANAVSNRLSESYLDLPSTSSIALLCRIPSLLS